MTDGQMSTEMTPGSHFRSQTESRNYIDTSKRLLLSLKDPAHDTIFNMPTLTDHQTLDMSGRDNRTPTHDAELGTPPYTLLPENAPSTTFIDAPVGWTYGMAIRQPHHDVEAILRMDDKEVIKKLKMSGLAGVAERLTYLYDVTEEDEEDIKLDSLRGFAALVIKNRGIHLPQITVTDDGLIQAVWRHSQQGTLVMNFQESGDVEFTLLYGRWDQGTKRRRLSGELPPDQVILHIDHFVRRIMET